MPGPSPRSSIAAPHRLSVARWAGAAAAAALLVVLLTVARPAELYATLLRTEPVPLAAALAVSVLVLALEAYRLGHAFAPEIARFSTSFGLTVESAFFAQLTPGLVGGEGYRVLWLRRRGGGLLRIVAILAFLRLVGLAVVAALALAALPLLADTVAADWWRPQSAATGLGVATAIGLVLALSARRFGGETVRQGLRQAVVGLREIGAGTAARIGAASLAIGLARGVVVLLLLDAVGERLAPLAAIAASALATLGAVVPLLPGGLGVQEGVLALVLTAEGVPASAAVSAVLLQRSLQWATALAGGLILLARKRRGSRSAPRGDEA